MKVRVTFRSEIVLEGKDLDEIKQKFEGIPLFSSAALENNADYIETLSVEDNDTYEDLSGQW